jgi:hypothetical protein
VRRGKARFPSGRQTHPATFAPAGSNRSSRGGDESAEAFGAEGHFGDLLDDVVVGKQEMVSAIDAVCDVAQRIIRKLKEGAAAGGPPLLGAAVGKDAGGYPPTPAMKRFADSLARQKGIKPPAGYKASISICRAFLNQHAPKKKLTVTAQVGLRHGLRS